MESNPFPGLRPYNSAEEDIFFGRSAVVREVAGLLHEKKFVTILGASGVGKSSLINGGVVPHLSKSGDKEDTDWTIASFRPGIDPFGNLADALASTGDFRFEGVDSRQSVLSKLKEGTVGLCSLAAGLPDKGNNRLLIIIDQFEELFHYSEHGTSERGGKDASSFIDMVVRTVREKTSNIFFIVTMKPDLIGECAKYPGLAALINSSSYFIPLMASDDFREVITGPVRYAGADIDTDLVELILSEIIERDDQLPVLQHAMMRTWSLWQKRGQYKTPLAIIDYESAGGMSNAMSLHADEAYEELSARGKVVCEALFKTITAGGTDTKGVRSPADIDSISAITGFTNEELIEVVEKFRIPERSFIVPGIDEPLTGKTLIDLSHESLIRLWDRLRHWVEAEVASAHIYLKLSEASELYQKGKAGLLRTPDLQMALRWREENNPTVRWAERYNPAFERAMVYLATSEKEHQAHEDRKLSKQKKQLRRSWIIARILGVAALTAVGLMLYAYASKNEAEKLRMIADQQTAIAADREMEAQARLREETVQKQLVADEARKARENESEARLALKNADRIIAGALTDNEQARIEKMRAQMNEQKAISLMTLAEESEKEAVAETERTYRLRMLDVGKKLSLKSLQMNGQRDIQTLLAYQAYLFNSKYYGVANDADIYAAMYNADKNYGGKHYQVLNGHQGEITSIAFVPGRNEFYTSGKDGKIIRWILEGKSDRIQIVYSGNAAIEVLAVSPDASWLAFDENTTIKMIPLENGGQPFDLQGHTGKLKSLVFSYDGSSLYSAGLDGKVFKWDLAARTGNDVGDASIRITSIDVSGRNGYMAGLSDNGEVIVWDPRNREKRFRPDLGGRIITSLRFEPETGILAVGDRTGKIEMWDIEKQARVSELQAHDAMVTSIVFNKRFNQMATAGFDKTIRIWARDDLDQPPVVLNDIDGQILTIQFSSNGEALISSTGSGTLVARAAHNDILADNICSLVTRNLTAREWSIYVGNDIEWEKTCQEKPFEIKIERR